MTYVGPIYRGLKTGCSGSILAATLGVFAGGTYGACVAPDPAHGGAIAGFIVYAMVGAMAATALSACLGGIEAAISVARASRLAGAVLFAILAAEGAWLCSALDDSPRFMARLSGGDAIAASAAGIGLFVVAVAIFVPTMIVGALAIRRRA